MTRTKMAVGGLVVLLGASVLTIVVAADDEVRNDETDLELPYWEDAFNGPEFDDLWYNTNQMTSSKCNVNDANYEEGRGKCKCANLNCGCCLNINLPAIGIRNKQCCANVSVVTHGDIGLKVSFTIGNRTIFSKTLSAKNPPAICIGIPFIQQAAGVCFKIDNIQIKDRTLCACAKISFKLFGAVIANIKIACFGIPMRGDEERLMRLALGWKQDLQHGEIQKLK